MADELEPTSGKKRRIIHWNPDAGREQVSRRWTWKHILAWTVGGIFGLLLAGRITVEITKLVLGRDFFNPRASAAMGAGTPAEANSAFVTQAKAEQAHELAAKALVELRRLPQDHPVQLQRLILIEKSFLEGQSLIASHDFAPAYQLFNSLNGEIKDFAENVKIKGEAKQSYDAIIIRIKDLEPARTLAPGTLEAAFEAAGSGRQLLNEGNFTGAKKIFDGGFAELKKAEQALADDVRRNLLAGQQALGKGDREGAAKAFRAALANAPGSEIALQGLKRSETIDRVYALVQQGENLEKQAQYPQAAESFKKAFALDPLSAVAQEGQARVLKLDKETRFAAAQTAAQAAFSRKEWAKVISEADIALKVYPDKKEMQTMLKSAKENAHKEAVQKLIAKGYAYENEHQWKEARDAYNETMQLEPGQQDAKEGYTRAGTMIRALLEYERRIEVAEQLANKAEFQAAIRRFNEAMAVKPAYLVNSDKVQQLHTMLMSQNQPVEVSFKSDGKTWVSITNFRMLGQIESTSLKILPGDYEIIGRRKGYRDVLMLLQVRNGTNPPTVTVMCSAPTGKT